VLVSFLSALSEFRVMTCYLSILVSFVSVFKVTTE